MQIKLLNANCTRIFIRGNVYITENQFVCKFYNMNNINIFHWLVDCTQLHSKRKLLYLKLFEDNSLNIEYYISNVSSIELKKFIVYLIYILEESQFKLFVKTYKL